MGKTEDEARRKAREDQNIKNLELGGVPTSAEERLRAQSVRPKPFFVTNLSVNEFSLVGKGGYSPVGQVMGSSVYHIGWQFSPGFGMGSYSYGYLPQSEEQTTLTQAHLEARNLALSRLSWETRLLNAHGVVGVRLERKMYEWGANLIDFSVTGTAIRIHGEPPTDEPFLSDLSGEEFYQLWQAGFKPVGFAYGNCFWYEVAGYANQWAQSFLTGGFQNQELTDFSKAVHRTRDLAMERLQRECNRMGACGVVGVNIERELRTREVAYKDGGVDRHRTDLMVHMQLTGTAIAEREITHTPPQGRIAVSLADLPLRKPQNNDTDVAIERTRSM